MHKYRQLIEDEMAKRRWRQRDLVRASGLSRAVVSRILSDTRGRLTQMPDDATIDGLARAFALPRDAVLSAIGEAMGIPLNTGLADLDEIPVDDLLDAVRRRIGADSGGGLAPNKHPESNQGLHG